jgi:hypothetical protein
VVHPTNVVILGIKIVNGVMNVINNENKNYHNHKHPVLGHLARSVSRVTVALSIISSVSQLFSFLVGCSGMITIIITTITIIIQLM